MKTFMKNLTKELDEELKSLEPLDGDVLKILPPAVKLLEQAFVRLKTFISNYTFKDEKEEILFFKEIKPLLFSKLIYFEKICKIEVMRPTGSDCAQKTYIERELESIKEYFDKNLDFYKYYRACDTRLDRYYFLRGQPKDYITLESFHFERDSNFSSACDFKVAKILANDLLAVYLKEELKKLEQPSCPTIGFPKTKETWTRNKTDLVELIYAFCEADCFNHGKTNLRRLTGYFENVFNIDLGNPYHTYIEIKERANRTQFLDELKAKLTAKMNTDDTK